MGFTDIPNFLAPTPSRGRPPHHQRISGPKSLGLCSVVLPEFTRVSVKMPSVCGWPLDGMCPRALLFQTPPRLPLIKGPFFLIPLTSGLKLEQQSGSIMLTVPKSLGSSWLSQLSGMFRHSASLAIPHRKSFAAIPSVSLVLLAHTNRNVSWSHESQREIGVV